MENKSRSPYIDQPSFYKGLGIMSCNIRSVRKNWIHLEDLINNLKYKPDIICLQELWQIPSKIEPTIEGYQNLVRKTREDAGSKKRGGGVGFLIKQGLSYETIKTPFITNTLETLGINIKHDQKYQIVNVYRPPKGDMNIAFNQLHIWKQDNTKK